MTAQSTTASTPSPEARRRTIERLYPQWVPRTLSQHLDHIAAQHSNAPLVITAARTYSYADIQAWSRELAAGLLQLDVQPGDKVAVIMGNFPEYVALKFALARIGAVTVAINFLLRKNELQYILEQSDATVLITMDRFGDRDYLADLDQLMPNWRSDSDEPKLAKIRHVRVFAAGDTASEGIAFDTLASSASAADWQHLDALQQQPLADSISDIVYTSGTTGAPKGVMLTHDMVLRAAFASAYTSGFMPGWKMLFALPMYHVFGYVECLIATTFVGGAIVPHLAFDPARMLADAEKYAVQELVAVPLMTMKLIDCARTRGFDGSALLIMFNSGGVSPPTLWGEIREVLGAREIITAYGMSETTASTTCTFPEGDDSFLLNTNGRLKYAGVAGDPALDGVLAIYKTIDVDSGEDLPYGASGELLVRGPIVTPGYYCKPEETAAAIDDAGWLHTGDVGTVSEDGYVTLTGRVKETYRCLGELVMPREVENTLNVLPGVAQAIVVGIVDPRLGEVGCACIVPEHATRPDAAMLRSHCEANLARFKVPKYFLFLSESDIPMTATGRPQKFRLTEKILAEDLLREAV